MEGTSLNMTLLRASSDPDPLPDLGEHVIEYALVPHVAGWTAGDASQAGEDLNVPLVVVSCGVHGGDLPPTASFVRVHEPNVRLAALKQSQDGAGVILRLVEVNGQATDATVTLARALAGASASAEAVDTLERPLPSNGAHLRDGTLTVTLPPYGIATVRIADDRR